MNEELKKQDQPKEPSNGAELEEQDIDQVSGGSTNNVRGIDIIVKKKPSGNITPLNPPSGSAK